MDIISDFLKIKQYLKLPAELELHLKFDWNEGFYRSNHPGVMIGLSNGYNRTLLVHECLHATGMQHYDHPDYTGHLSLDKYSAKVENEIFDQKYGYT